MVRARSNIESLLKAISYLDEEYLGKLIRRVYRPVVPSPVLKERLRKRLISKANRVAVHNIQSTQFYKFIRLRQIRIGE